MKNLVLSIVCSLACWSMVFAQTDPNLDISLYLGYEQPTGAIKDIYRPTTSYQLGFTKYIKPVLSASLTVGYMAFSPEEDEYQLDPPFEDATITYSKLLVVPIMSGIEFHIDPKLFSVHADDEMIPLVGIDFGYFYTAQSITYKDEFTDFSLAYVLGRYTIAPKAQLDFNISDHVGLFARVRYNIMFTFSSNTTNPNANTTVTVTTLSGSDNILSTGGGLRFMF